MKCVSKELIFVVVGEGKGNMFYRGGGSQWLEG